MVIALIFGLRLLVGDDVHALGRLGLVAPIFAAAVVFAAGAVLAVPLSEGLVRAPFGLALGDAVAHGPGGSAPIALFRRAEIS